jgi:3,5-epimerase/4-reductase
MKFLVYGHKGWIGNQVIEILKKSNFNYILGKSRVNNKEQLEKEIFQHKPTNIISTIGRTHGKIGNKVYGTIDYLEQKGKVLENVRDNLFGPMLLSILSKKYDIHLTYLGTGCIFKFDEDHPFGKEENGFTEESLPNFFGSSYSIIKGFTDELMHLFEENVLNVRIRMPITSDLNKRNFITKITNYEFICNVPNSMTVLDELLPLIIDMSMKKKTGTVNLCNPGLISHNEILEMYKEIVDKDFTWKNFSIEEQDKILAAERSNNFLDTSKLEEMYPNVKNIKESIRICLENMSK